MITKAKAPGKLYLAGEYSVTLPGHASIIFAVDRYMFVTLSDLDKREIILKSDKLAPCRVALDQLTPTEDIVPEWHLALSTLQVLQTWLTEQGLTLGGLSIEFTSDLDIDGKKIGLGSSAALVVALIKAVANHFNLELSKLNRFKLGAIALTLLPNFKNGSMGDVAAASFNNVIYYQRFDNAWLQSQLDSYHAGNLINLLALDWPKLDIHTIAFPEEWQLLVGWTGQPADTQQLLLVNARVARIYKDRLGKKTTPLIKILEKNIQNADYIGFKTNLRLNQKALIAFSEAMRINYLTPKLHELVAAAYHRGIASKISGAGNGDNGIAIVTNAEAATNLTQKWESFGIKPLNLHIATDEMEDDL